MSKLFDELMQMGLSNELGAKVDALGPRVTPPLAKEARDAYMGAIKAGQANKAFVAAPPNRDCGDQREHGAVPKSDSRPLRRGAR